MGCKPTTSKPKQAPVEVGGNPPKYFLLGETQEIGTNTMLRYLKALENNSGENRISPYEIKSEVK
jgi:hypothetical protein